MPGITNTSLRELDRMMATSVRRLRETCAVDLTFGGPLNLGESHSITIRHLDGHLGPTLRHLRVQAGAGLGGKALKLGKPITVQDYFNAPQIVHAYDHAVAPERVDVVTAVPVRMHGTAVGLLYLARRDNTSFGDRILSRAVAAAQHMERDLLVEQEVRRRLGAHSASGVRDNRALDEIHGELETTIALVGDPVTRERLRSTAEKLRRAVGGSPGPAETAGPPRGPLSAREVEVLELVATGASNNDVAAALGLMPNTVKAYLRSITRKLGTSNRTHAVRLAREARLIS